MRYIRPASLAALVLVLLCGVSFAGPITDSLTFVNVGPGNQVGGEYSYPYYFSINGSPTLTPMLCDTYLNNINFGESWQATVTPLTSSAGLWRSLPNAAQDYRAAAILYSWILNGTVPSGQVTAGGISGNLAIWALFDGGRSNPGWVAADQTLINQALADTRSQSLSFYSQFQVFSPIAGTQSQGGVPQEFILCNSGGPCAPPAPMLSEPASLPVLASGLVMMSGLLRRKFYKTPLESPFL